MAFELWDGEVGRSLGSFDTELDALAEVRRLCRQSDGLRAPLGLVADDQTVVATGDDLVERAFALASSA